MKRYCIVVFIIIILSSLGFSQTNNELYYNLISNSNFQILSKNLEYPKDIINKISITSEFKGKLDCLACQDIFYKAYYDYTYNICKREIKKYKKRYSIIFDVLSQLHNWIIKVRKPGSYHEINRLPGKLNFYFMMMTKEAIKHLYPEIMEIREVANEYLEKYYRIEGPEDKSRMENLKSEIDVLINKLKDLEHELNLDDYTHLMNSFNCILKECG